MACLLADDGQAIADLGAERPAALFAPGATDWDLLAGPARIDEAGLEELKRARAQARDGRADPYRGRPINAARGLRRAPFTTTTKSSA